MEIKKQLFKQIAVNLPGKRLISRLVLVFQIALFRFFFYQLSLFLVSSIIISNLGINSCSEGRVKPPLVLLYSIDT
jgi:hypothetical protein